MKVLFLQEYIRDTHVVKNDLGHLQADFLSTNLGRKLSAYAREIGLRRADYFVDYAYDMIPDVQKTDPKTGRVLKYVEPAMALRKEPEARLVQRIMKLQPDIIIPMGNIGCKFLLGVQAITKLRGRPEQVTLHQRDSENKVIHSFQQWVLPIYSMEYITAQPNAERFVQTDMRVLQKFLKEGEKAYLAKESEYEFTTDIERIREIFAQFRQPRAGYEDPRWLVSWDLETNTLKPELLGAKILVFSLSWEEGQGVTIPVEHKEFTWSKEHLAEIKALLLELVECPNIVKVGHNIQYDLRFLKSTTGLKQAHHNRDTKVGYYLAISQEKDVSLRLSDLAYEMTDMGGYDAPLDEYKAQYVKDYKEREALRVKEAFAKEEAEWKAEVKRLTAEDKALRAQYKEAGRKLNTIPKVVMPPKPRKQSPIPLVNEIDNSDFNYEWIPLEVLAPYASGDTDCCLRIYKILEKKLKESPRMWELFSGYYPRLSYALASIESTGVQANLKYISVIEEQYTKETERLTEKIRELPCVQAFEQRNQELYELGIDHFVNTPPKERDPELVKLRERFRKSGIKFRPTADNDKKQLLFNMLGIRLPYDKESIVDTAWDAGIEEHDIKWNHYKSNKHNLEIISQEFAEHKPLADLLLEFSKVNTLKTNFTTKLLEQVSNKDGRVHGSFNSTGTECVAGDTLLVTSQGIVEIQNLSTSRQEKTFVSLEQDLRVPTHLGSTEVSQFYYSGKNTGLKITLSDGTELVTTRNHPLLRNNYYRNKRGAIKANWDRYNEHLNDLTWVDAENLTPDDYLAFAINTQMYGKEVQLPYVTLPGGTDSNAIQPPTILSKELAEWVGMYMSDGHMYTDEGFDGVYFTHNTPEVRNHFVQLTQDLFNISEVETQTWGVRISSTSLYHWLYAHFNLGCSSKEKEVPQRILSAPKEVQEAFIRGVSLNASLKSKHYPIITLSSVSEKLMRQVKVMLQNMGMFSNLKNRRDLRGSSSFFTLDLTFDRADQFCRDIRFIQVEKEKAYWDKRETYTSTKTDRLQGTLIGDTHFLVKIVSIDEVKSQDFFDLHVPEAHSFVGNGVYNHNTSRLSSSNPKQDWGYKS